MTCPFCRRPFALHPFLRQPLAAHDSLTLAQRAAADGGATGAQHASGAWAVWFWELSTYFWRNWAHCWVYHIMDTNRLVSMSFVVQRLWLFLIIVLLLYCLYIAFIVIIITTCYYYEGLCSLGSCLLGISKVWESNRIPVVPARGEGEKGSYRKRRFGVVRSSLNDAKWCAALLHRQLKRHKWIKWMLELNETELHWMDASSWPTRNGLDRRNEASEHN
jgi:hypothetical protein